MGRKAALITAGVGGLVFILTLGASFLPLHTVAILSLHKKLARIRLGTVWVQIDAKIPQLWCDAMPVTPPEDVKQRRREIREDYGKQRQYWCKKTWNEIQSVQDVSQRACAASVDWLWPSLCTGLSSAYWVGWIVLIFMVGNAVIVQATVAFLLHDYATRRPKKQLRRLATSMIGVGAFAMSVIIVAYAFLVSATLDDGRNGRMGRTLSIPRFFLNTSEGFGVDWGFVVLIGAVIVQIIQLVCCRWIRTSEEDEVEEAKERERAKLHGYGSVEDQEMSQSGLGSAWYVPQMATPAMMEAGPPVIVGAAGGAAAPGVMMATGPPVAFGAGAAVGSSW